MTDRSSSRRRPGRRRVAIAAIAAIAALAAGCSTTGQQAATSSSTTEPSSAPSTSAGSGDSSTTTSVPADSGSVQWQDCGGLECGRIRVPLDYAKPDGEKIELTAWIHRATDPAEKIGTLFINPGGPGGTGKSIVENIDFMAMPPEVLQRFDIVGFDPRGAGDSAPLSCGADRYLQEMYDADPTPQDATERAEVLKVSQAYVDQCEKGSGDELPFMGTLNVARDLDEWRKAVGDEKLTYVGYSYGTSIGQMYAQLFPTKIRAMVLDGVVDTEQSGLEAAVIQAGGFERALQAFYADCKQDQTCAITPNPAAVTSSVIAKAEQTPIPAPGADRPASPGVIQLGIGQALYAKALWPSLADALNQANKGNGSGLVDLADQYMQREPDGSYPNTFDVYFAVSCLDSTWPTDPNAVFAAADAAGKKYPTLGEGLVNDYVRCPLWPVKPQPLPKLTAEGSPPILVISTTRDPATPYENGVRVAKRLPQGVLLTNVGDGHTVFGNGKACIDDKVGTYLVDLEPPKNGTRCE